MPRLALTRAARALAVLLAACCSTLAGHTAAQSGRIVVITGRVVDAGGQPFDGAQVDLVSPDTPHRAPYVMATSTTDASGRFDLPRRYFDRLVITAGGETYAYRPRDDGEGVSANARTEIQLGDLPIGPLRDLIITAECPAAGQVSITIEWLGHGLLHPRIMPEGFGFLNPPDYGTRHGLNPRHQGGRIFDRTSKSRRARTTSW